MEKEKREKRKKERMGIKRGEKEKRDKDNGDEALLKPGLALAGCCTVMRAKPWDPRPRNSRTRKHSVYKYSVFNRTTISLCYR